MRKINRKTPQTATRCAILVPAWYEMESTLLILVPHKRALARALQNTTQTQTNTAQRHSKKQFDWETAMGKHKTNNSQTRSKKQFDWETPMGMGNRTCKIFWLSCITLLLSYDTLANGWLSHQIHEHHQKQKKKKTV
jgi:hypothetical protein